MQTEEIKGKRKIMIVTMTMTVLQLAKQRKLKTMKKILLLLTQWKKGTVKHLPKMKWRCGDIVLWTV
jgi:hypothetical protein